MKVQQGITCPNCGHELPDITQVSFETQLSPKNFVVSALIGLGMGLSVAAIGTTWWGALGATILASGVAFMVSVRIFASYKSTA
ncbi:hypothetical protein LCGC14_1312100 [marine sediment metagenome]|uniref:Uncharacterized protein n=1 Tax=marine sediment metagenome TaxID=412755 RepID=A0A0F9N2Y8_9ZZZZ